MFAGVAKRASSWFQITCSIRPMSWPPYSFGQVRQAQPASNLHACHAFEARIASLSSRSRSGSTASPSGSRSFVFCSSQPRARARKAASSGVSSKSIVGSSASSGPPSGGLARLQALDQELPPGARRPEPRREQLRAAVEEMAVVLPGEADAAVDLDHLAGGELEGVARGGAEGAGRELELVAARREGPGRPVAIRARELDRGVEVGEAVLDHLERRDRPAEGVAAERILARQLERARGAAELLEASDHRGAVEERADRRGAVGGPERLARRGVEGEPDLRAARVEGGERRARDPRALEIDERERRALRAARRDDGEAGDAAVEDGELLAAHAALL